ncbi:isoprenylcysteine carboxylmethyltransferase family protein [Microvirga sp. BT688]|uniref:methyltransferase family protein n=1 Tax=Microvirga sp. TaxID=1873136 RepID=UPI0016865476|nr:isoprenylcysteine carboxylmethyltransferase family protein [Microvirga sp.]MBD2749090.1 isoprenylcysteine carboxylmethyltransferase family protein [Microvirga sp.]
MSTLVIVLRAVSLLAFVGPMLLRFIEHPREPAKQARHGGANRVPVAANLAAFALFLLSLLLFPGTTASSLSLLLASLGSVLAVAGAAVVLRSRVVLGPAWSFVPDADQETGLVTTGPYRFVRHPIYLGLVFLAAGQALAFSSLPAFAMVLFGIIPTFVWRARAEEKLLSRIFGERYKVYQQRTKVIIPHFL